MTDTLERPTPTRTTPRKFTVTAVDHEQVDAGAYRVRSDYTEKEWLGYLGPTAILLARRFDLALSSENKIAADTDKLAAALGVEPADITAACHRLVRYGLASWSDKEPLYTMARFWPAVPAAIRTPQHRQVLIDLPDTETQ